MQFDIQEFLISRAIAENANASEDSVNRIALVTSMMGLGMAQSAIFTAILAGNQAPPPAAPAGNVPAVLPLHKRVKTPNLKHHTAAKNIHEHLGEHKLRARIHSEPAAEVKAPRVIFQWPEPDMELDPDSEVHVVMLVPLEETPEISKRK